MHTLTLSTLLCILTLTCRAQDTKPLTLQSALTIARSDNTSLAIARKESSIAQAEGRELNAMWYPSVTIAGEYTHTLSGIAAVTSLGTLAGDVLNTLEPLIASNPPLLGIVEGIADTPIRLPLVPRNTASVGVEIGWMIFSGGRRIQASKIARAMTTLATQKLSATESAIDLSVVESYFGAQLAEEVVALRKKSLESLTEHLRQARSLEREGLLIPAERLTAEVAVEQAKALLATAHSNALVAHNALLTLLNTNFPSIDLSTPLFMPSSLPTKEALYTLIEQSPTIGMFRQQTAIATHSLTIEKGRYLPSVALLGHQQLWSVGLNKNLFPRTAVGVGLSWTLFDGLAREGAVARSRSQLAASEFAEQKAVDDIRLAIDKFHSTMIDSRAEYEAECTTERLAEELVRSRRKAFGEGLATSSEVVDAEVLLCGARVAKMVALYELDIALCSLLAIVGCTDNYLDYIEL
ncbi:MAG: TolC family protein [Tidjanibacter sp.]|nr:TolC family protein [Tidjanibacter sp.]